MNIFLGMMIMVMLANHAQNEAPGVPRPSNYEALEDSCEGCTCDEDCECFSCVLETMPTLTLVIPLAFDPRQ